MIFDLDGTLVDSFSQIATSSQNVRLRLGMTNMDFGKIRKLIGLPAEELFSDSPENIEEAVRLFRTDLLHSISKENKCFPGTVDLLKEFKSKGYALAVATSKPQYIAETVVENSSLHGLIDHVQGLENFPAKPNPEVIIRCQVRLPSSKYVMFGDRPEDVIAARNSNCIAVGIAQGEFNQEELRKAGAFLTFQDIQALLNEIDNLITELENYGK